MTVKRQLGTLEQHLALLGRLVEQYKDDFALRTEEAELLEQTVARVRQLADAKEFTSLQTYAEQCAAYYQQEREHTFFHDVETGKRIFAEIATAYRTIASAKP